MRLTQKSKYAARAMVEIALGGRGPLGVAEIARRQRIPERFLGQIFGELRRGGILRSRRGAHGGYCLAIPAEEVTVLDIVEILDGRVRPDRYSEGGGRHVDDAPPCPTGKVWEEARVALEGVFGRYSIAQLAEAERGSREERESPDLQATRGPPLLRPL
ncbi:MAG: Iron-sulfur cluster regulator IscR [uncultured Rubrobacteraceae bacterium]|uniref:Iron-sulfur cluster regulator IscR n=1 Tax=uncultured Rubrobacteraceae bacterium TaxID=349277 RepID=A0A6J4QRP7_9ACTN|nr:MAG: Iron-sulfur cluster regulator IscR [uncultured Rubrobacteraceae bacterium]